MRSLQPWWKDVLILIYYIFFDVIRLLRKPHVQIDKAKEYHTLNTIISNFFEILISKQYKLISVQKKVDIQNLSKCYSKSIHQQLMKRRLWFLLLLNSLLWRVWILVVNEHCERGVKLWLHFCEFKQLPHPKIRFTGKRTFCSPKNKAVMIFFHGVIIWLPNTWT